jgi:hypothetical protein
MGVALSMQALRLAEDGSVSYLDGPDAKFTLSSYDFYEIVEAIEDRRGTWQKGDPTFAWYHSACNQREYQPNSTNTFDPSVVLRSLQEIERELSKYQRRYPAQWVFVTLAPDGREVQHHSLAAIYKGRRCLFYSDEQGPWAKETDPGLRECVHHELAKEPQISVQLEADGPAVPVTVRRLSLLAQYGAALAAMKRVCRRAIEERALLYAAAG